MQSRLGQKNSSFKIKTKFQRFTTHYDAVTQEQAQHGDIQLSTLHVVSGYCSYYIHSYGRRGDYWKLFLWSWKYSPRPKDEGNISNFGEIIFNSHR